MGAALREEGPSEAPPPGTGSYRLLLWPAIGSLYLSTAADVSLLSVTSGCSNHLLTPATMAL
jgi:hypothetical protein